MLPAWYYQPFRLAWTSFIAGKTRERAYMPLPLRYPGGGASTAMFSTTPQIRLQRMASKSLQRPGAGFEETIVPRRNHVNLGPLLAARRNDNPERLPLIEWVLETIEP